MKKLIIIIVLLPSLVFAFSIQEMHRAVIAAKNMSTDVGYGVIWDQSTDTYDIGTLSNGTFTEEAIGSFPIQAAMQRVVLSDAGVVQYYLCATDSTYKADCSTPSVLDGTDGQVMVQIPKFHFIQAQYGNNRYFFVGENEFTLTLPDESTETSAIHPAFYKAGSATASDYRYIGAYEGTMYDASNSAMTAVGSIHSSLYASGDKMCSVSGQYPKTAETISENRTMATARGTGWHQFSGYDQAMLSILFITEYGSLRSQQSLGYGRTSLSGGTWIAGENGAGGYIGIAGLSNGNGNASGNVSIGGNIAGSQSGDYMSYRGIENWWGNVWQFMDGFNVNNSTADGSRLYMTNNYTNFASNTDTNYTLIGSLAQADGWPTDIIDEVGIWPESVGGSNSTYIADYYSTYFNNNPDSGWYTARINGGAADGDNAGAFYAYLSGTSGNAPAWVGARLCF